MHYIVSAFISVRKCLCFSDRCVLLRIHFYTFKHDCCHGYYSDQILRYIDEQMNIDELREVFASFTPTSRTARLFLYDQE